MQVGQPPDTNNDLGVLSGARFDSTFTAVSRPGHLLIDLPNRLGCHSGSFSRYKALSTTRRHGTLAVN